LANAAYVRYFAFLFVCSFGWKRLAFLSAEDLGVEVDAAAVDGAGSAEQRHGHAEHPEERERERLSADDHSAAGPAVGSRCEVLSDESYNCLRVLVQSCTDFTRSINHSFAQQNMRSKNNSMYTDYGNSNGGFEGWTDKAQTVEHLGGKGRAGSAPSPWATDRRRHSTPDK